MGRFGAGLLGDLRSPAIPLPVQTLGGRLFRHTFPPNPPIGRERDIGEDGVARQRRHRIGICLPGGSGSYSEESRLRIDGAQPTLFVRTNPGDVIAYRPNLPALEALW